MATKMLDVVGTIKSAYSTLSAAIEQRNALRAEYRDRKRAADDALATAEQAIAEALPDEAKVSAWRAGVEREAVYASARAAMRAADDALALTVGAIVADIAPEASSDDAALVALGVEAVASLAYRAAQKARR